MRSRLQALQACDLPILEQEAEKLKNILFAHPVKGIPHEFLQLLDFEQGRDGSEAVIVLE
jgi:hypothetical protein